MTAVLASTPPTDATEPDHSGPTAPGARTVIGAAHARRTARPRLTHVDAMRPVKQLGVVLQFYLIYPAFLWLIRRTERHHWRLLGVSLAAELVLAWLVHEQYLPAWMLNQAATR